MEPSSTPGTSTQRWAPSPERGGPATPLVGGGDDEADPGGEPPPELDSRSENGLSNHPDLKALAGEWTSVVMETSFVPMTRDEVEQYLLHLTCRLADALVREPFCAGAATKIGADIVATRFTGEFTFSRTLQLLGNGLLALPGSGQERPNHMPLDGAAAKVVALLAAFADGYAGALRAEVFAQQENLRQATVSVMDASERALKISEMRFDAVFGASAVGIVMGDLEGHIVETNPAMLEILGYPAEELRQRTMYELLHPDDAASFTAYCADVATGKRDHFRAQPRLVRSDSEPVWTHAIVSLIRDTEGEPAFLLVMVENGSDVHLLQQRLRHQALHDPLTGLPNRELFRSRLESTLECGSPLARVALCYLDIDSFRVINQGLGFRIGDELLRSFATRLRSAVLDDGPTTPQDPLIARIGGDAFAVLVDGSAGAPSTVAMIERVLARLSEPFYVQGHVLSVSASASIVERPRAGSTTSELMRQAAMTLRWAKVNGKAQWALFDPDRDGRDRATFALAAAMPFALEIGEFQLAYQPLVRLRDGAVIGAEALLRWHHPELGILPPERFLGLAAETGFIVPLGQWALREACEHASQWQRQFGDSAPFVSISLPARLSHDPDLIRHVRTILQETGLPPGQLQLQVGAEAIDAEHGDTLDALEVLTEMGVRIVIDGFGASYADVGRLRQLPVRGLKIPAALLAGLADGSHADPVDQQILTNLVSTAHVLRLVACTDGVETAAQAAQLKDMGGDIGQGSFFAPPGPPEAIRPLIITGTTR